MRKAVIPAAGLGTRMRPWSEVVPKELVPLGTKPAIQFAVDEALGAGIAEIAVVVSPDKGLLRDYLDRFGDPSGRARFTYVTQETPRGLGDAILCCRDFAAGEPFAVLLPDNVLLSPAHDFGRLVRASERSGLDAIGVIEVTHADSGRYGNCGRIEFRVLEPGLLELERLYDKLPGTLQVPPGETLLRTCGRYACTQRLLDELAQLRATTGDRVELDEVPAYQRIVASGGAVGVVLPPPLFDVGNPSGYLAACAAIHERHGAVE
ncbi:MAG TPA: sugar phosphate nucleotidyltransferase [Thermoanaerobaculia bacterium]|nr:sugar phosphate nucleotidyltransferase [Thermoanaerobaculia bacterium]